MLTSVAIAGRRVFALPFLSSRALPSRRLSTSTKRAPKLDMTSAAFWNDVSTAGYDESLFGYHCGAFAEQIVRRHSGASSRFLDVGTGTGHVTLALANKYPQCKVGCHV